MGYLVKASFDAEPRAYALEGIKTDAAAKLLSATALVRHEKQDFWYSVGELIGEAPAKPYSFACPCCQAMTQAREIDVGLEVSCQACGERVLVPDIQPIKDASSDQPLLRRGNLLLFGGLTIIIGAYAFAIALNRTDSFLPNFLPPVIEPVGYVGSVVIVLAGVCMMINGYGKRQLYYRKHPPADDPPLFS